MSVKPARGSPAGRRWDAVPSHPARHILILVGSARLAVSAKRPDLEPAAPAGIAVMMGVAPRVGRHLVLLQIGAVPVGDVAGASHQRRKSFVLVRIAAD